MNLVKGNRKDITLPYTETETPSTLTGTLKSSNTEDNTVLSDIPVQLITDTGDTIITKTDENGNFEFTGVPEGTSYKILVNGNIIQDNIDAIGEVELGDVTIDYNKYQDTNPGNQSTILAEGTVITAPIVVTVPTSLSFIIQPKATNTLYTVPVEVTNESKVPLDLTINEITAISDTAPELVAPTTYTDSEWLGLSQADTESKIAIGLNNGTQDNWLNDKFSLSGNSSINIKPCVKYGLNWQANRDDLDYNISLLVSLHE